MLVKVWVFWECHKIWKNLCRTFDKSVVFCARNSVLVKKSTKIFETNVTSRIIQTLTKIRKNLAVIFSKTVRCHCSPITYSMWNVQEKQRKQTPSWSIFDIALSLFCYTIYYWCSYNKGDFHKIHVRTLSYIPCV